MLDALFAADLGTNKYAVYAIKGLAVGGAFLAGFFLGRFFSWALDRWLFAAKAPPVLKRSVEVATGLLVAILVALFIFGEGGNGMFGRGGSGDGKGVPNDDGKGKPQPAPPDPKKEDPKKEDPKPPAPKPTPGDLHVTILTDDDVKGGKFYLIGDDPAPKSIEELKAAVEARRKAAGPELRTVFYRFKGEELGPDHPRFRLPDVWLKELKINFARE